MIIVRLLSSQIPSYWEHIKYASVTANGMQDSAVKEEYCRNLLCNLLSGKYSCWVGTDDSREFIKAVAITKIYKDAGDIHHMLIDAVYVYDATSDTEKFRFIGNVKEFAEEIGCKNVMFNTGNPSIIKAAGRLGFNEAYRVYTAELGG
jgi:hypothetical protein